MKEKSLKKSFYLLILIISALVLFQLEFDYLNAQDDDPDYGSNVDEECVWVDDGEGGEPSFRTYGDASGNGNERTLRFQGDKPRKQCRQSCGPPNNRECPTGKICASYLKSKIVKGGGFYESCPDGKIRNPPCFCEPAGLVTE